jgi:hypothetical protein
MAISSRIGFLSVTIGFAAVLCAGSVCRASGPEGSPGRAKRQKPAKKENRAKAKKLFRAGTAKYRKGKLDEAIELFKRAYSHWNRRSILLNIAVCYAEKDEPVPAVEHLSKALSGAKPEEKEAIRGQMPEKLKEAERSVGKLDITPPDESATVMVDGEPIGSGRVEVFVKVGSHRIVVKDSAGARVERKVEVVGGKTASVTVESFPVAPKAAKATSGASKQRGWWQKRPQLPIYYFGAAAAVTLVSGVAAIATGAKTKTLHDDYYDSPSRSTRDSGLDYKNATNALIGITVVAGVATGVLAVFTEWRWPFGDTESPTAVRAVPTVAPGSAGVSVSGRF